MRVIKFRAWHKDAKEMLTGEAHRVLTWEAEGQPLEVMQFTGLLDKNGKEIYEGDFIKLSLDGDIGKVTFAGGAFYFDINGEETEYLVGEFKQSEIEIIGNIYENPDILK